MLSKDISRYSKLRYEIRAYLFFIFEQNIKNYMPNMSFEHVQASLYRIQDEIESFHALYVLDSNGRLYNKIIGKKLTASYHNNLANTDLSNKAFYYEAIKEKRCILTDPYPSRIDGKLVVTASYPCYDKNDNLICIACIDMILDDALKLVSPSNLYNYFSTIITFLYSFLSILLFLVATLLTIKGLSTFIEAIKHFNNFDIKEIFESTILLTLSLAIFDLVKTIFEEEVLGKNANDNKTIHKTMVRFLGSIIVAIAIEILMLVFKFTITQPDKLIYAVYLMGGVFLLLIGLSIYIKFTYYSIIPNKRYKNKYE